MSDEIKPLDQQEPMKPKRGRPKGSKSKVVNLKAIRAARALLECNTNPEAYKKLHPNATDSSASKNAHRLVTPETIEALKELLQADRLVDITKDNLVRLFTVVVAKYMSGKESGANFIRALENLKQLVPEFVDRKLVNEVSVMTEKDIDKELEKFGVTPDVIKRYSSLDSAQGAGLPRDN